MAALDLANQVRVDRAKLRLKIGAGEVRASAVLAGMPDCIRGCGAYTFLTYIRSVSSRPRRTETAESVSKAFVLLRRAKCIEVGHKRLDQLTPGQLERLTRVVRDYEDNRHPAERGLA
jgi:hypothetical protein